MSQAKIDKLIINKPYEEPTGYWDYVREKRGFERLKGRRAAGYLVASEDSKTFDDPGVFVEIPLVNDIRVRVQQWRTAGYPGVTGITRRLLEYWTNPEEFDARRFFFCQLEAAETLIWLTKVTTDKSGVEVPSDGGPFQRQCCKMATGSGKTVVMAMVIAWQVLNKVSNPQDPRFSKNVLVVAPGLTVRSRLAVLGPARPENYYDEFLVVPSDMQDKLRQGKVMVRNWHALNWETDKQIAKKRSVDKRGSKSDEAYVREALGEMARARNLLVINDEAHHAWRVPAGTATRGMAKADVDEATKWVGGLDRIHRARGILACYDFSATPFTPSGRKSTEEALFGWIVSDFGLNDAIESGLVKTPRVVIRDDALPDTRTYRPRLYHIYNDPEVRDNLNRKAQVHEPLPDLVTNAYYLLGYDWRETARSWEAKGTGTPPVMITVANRTETAARVKYAFDRNNILIDDLCDPERTLHIDSRVLKRAEETEEPIAQLALGMNSNAANGTAEEKLTADQRAERLRRMVDTVGRPGQPGEQIQNVISVGMLSEGWDAKTVTHIMGLRAFTSQLLCEQVVGRGLRRTAYDEDSDGLLTPEYVNIFGIPFTFLPHETTESGPPKPTEHKTAIEPVADKAGFEIKWPNIVRIEHVYRPLLSLDPGRVTPLNLNASNIRQIADMAPIVSGKPDVTKVSSIDLENLAREQRSQRIVFQIARNVFDQMKTSWKGSQVQLIAQLIPLVERLLASDRINVTPPLFYQDEVRRRLVFTLSMNELVRHIWEAIRFENTESLEPVFDRDHPIRSTADMRTWYTGKPCERAERSHVNFCVFDSTWEASEAFELDHNPAIDAWVKNDHLGFEVVYVYRGVVRKYRPDFLIRLKSGKMLVLETKGQDDEQNRTKRRFLAEWTKAVNRHGEFGQWSWDVSKDPSDIKDVLARH